MDASTAVPPTVIGTAAPTVLPVQTGEPPPVPEPPVPPVPPVPAPLDEEPVACVPEEDAVGVPEELVGVPVAVDAPEPELLLPTGVLELPQPSPTSATRPPPTIANAK
jgi:hypothetical protein